MTTLTGLVLQAAGAALAWTIADRQRYHRPAARFLALYAAADATRAILAALVLSRGPRPFQGPARVVFHLDAALTLAPPVALLALALRTWLGRGAAHVWGAAALLFAALTVSYPALRGPALLAVYQGAHALALAIAWACFAWWLWHRGPGRWPSWSEAIVLVWIAAETALLASPWTPEGWELGDTTRLARDLATVAVQVAWVRALTPAAAREGGA